MAIGPVLLLAAACAALVFALGLNAVLDEATPAQTAEPTEQGKPAATGNP